MLIFFHFPDISKLYFSIKRNDYHIFSLCFDFQKSVFYPKSYTNKALLNFEPKDQEKIRREKKINN